MNQTPWEREQLDYQDRRDIDSMEGARLLGWFAVGLVLAVIVFGLWRT